MLDRITNLLIDRGPDILFAIVIFIIGRYIAKLLKNIAVRMMTHANYDHTVITFVSQIIYYAVMALVVLSAVNKLGVPTTSFIAPSTSSACRRRPLSPSSAPSA